MRALFTGIVVGLLSVGCNDGAVGSLDGSDELTEPDPSPSKSAEQPATAGPNATPSSTAPVASPPPPTSSGSFSLSVDKTAGEVELRGKTSFSVTVTPGAGFSGAVALAAKGLPTGATGVFAPPSVDLRSGPQTATLTVETLSTAQVGSSNLEVAGIAGSDNASASVAFTVKPMITISVLKGEKGLPDGMGFGGGPIVLRLPTVSTSSPVKVLFRNDDAIAHRIHAGGQSGFVHGANAIPAGGADPVRTVTAKGNFEFYLHGETPEHRTTLQIQ